ncbi:MAG: HAD family hydrolase [Collinsella sp.]|nr:HAD family hydrolase [Collinsella sp.]
MATRDLVMPVAPAGESAPPWRIVLWDFDGTLADTSGDVWASVGYAAQKFGSELPVEFTEVGSNLALPMVQIMSSLSPALGAEQLEEFDAAVTLHYRTLSSHALTEFFPGIESLLKSLSETGVRHWIVTNKPQGALDRLLAIKGWTDLFDGRVSPDSAGEAIELSKEQMIDIVLNKVGVPPRECVMIGDSWGDVMAARNRGTASIAVTYGDGDVERLLACSPDNVANDVEELSGLLLRG